MEPASHGAGFTWSRAGREAHTEPDTTVRNGATASLKNKLSHCADGMVILSFIDNNNTRIFFTLGTQSRFSTHSTCVVVVVVRETRKTTKTGAPFPFNVLETPRGP